MVYYLIQYLTNIILSNVNIEIQNQMFLQLEMFLIYQQASITMILLMTVNGWVFLSMALGIGIGSFIFYPMMPAYEKHQREDAEKLNRVN